MIKLCGSECLISKLKKVSLTELIHSVKKKEFCSIMFINDQWDDKGHLILLFRWVVKLKSSNANTLLAQNS